MDRTRVGLLLTVLFVVVLVVLACWIRWLRALHDSVHTVTKMMRAGLARLHAPGAASGQDDTRQ